MCDPHYLILTKMTEGADAWNWGIATDDAGLTVAEDGKVHAVSHWKVLPQEPQRILVLNISDENLKERMEEYKEQISKILGKSPRVWVHFGDINSAQMRVEKLCEHWSRKEYDSFRGFTDQPMPYSQTAPAEFDRYVKELSGKIKKLLVGGNKTTATLTDMDDVLTGLNEAWQMAVAKFHPEDIKRVAKAQVNFSVAEALMPVFIYLDGLVYADEKARDKLEEMTKVVREGVPEVLGAVSEKATWDWLQKKVKKSQDDMPEELGAIPEEATSRWLQEAWSYKEDLSGVGSVESKEALVKMGKEFCNWYRNFLKEVMPDSEAKSETTQETQQ